LLHNILSRYDPKTDPHDRKYDAADRTDESGAPLAENDFQSSCSASRVTENAQPMLLTPQENQMPLTSSQIQGRSPAP
jgi:hypothetical protein